MSLTYPTFCQWFLAHYGRAFAASEAEYEAALRQSCHKPLPEDVHYLDGQEEQEGLYR